MMRRWSAVLVLCGWIAAMPAAARQTQAGGTQAAPLAFGETFTIPSKVLNETRRINVFKPTIYGEAIKEPMPVLYMPDGGMAEDFIHVAGLVQVLVANGTMRPFLVVGIENTERRRDMTGPTEDPEDRKIAARVGGSQAFRTFIRTELMPVIRERYQVTAESSIVGESLAGLFVVETFLREPDLFDTYLAFDPSLWWNKGALVTGSQELLQKSRDLKKTLYMIASDQKDLADWSRQLGERVKAGAGQGITSHYEQMPAETHATIYHPAAMKAFRAVLRPAGSKDPASD
jgi:predicted alpha/beta superfamily hydrolase